MESEFPSNSNASKAAPSSGKGTPKKKVERVTTGEVIQRKKSLGKRFKETFTGDDTRSVGSYVLFDVLVPGAKEMINDAIREGVERKLFGESRTRRGGSPRVGGMFGNATYNAYSRYSANSSIRPDPRGVPGVPGGSPSRRGRAERHSFNEIILQSRPEAMEVIDNLIAIVSQYDVASVADLYDLLGVSGEFTDEKWGWTDLRGADVQRVSEGFLLVLPRPEPID